MHGTGRLAVALACTLAGAGVGRIHMNDSGEVHRHDAAPGGLVVADEGRRFNEAAHDAIRRAAPGVDTRALGPAERPDLVVLTGEAPVAPELRDWLHERSVAHLAVRSGADDAVVGPLVLPGLTSCLECADRARLDRDPAWSVLAVQLATPRRHPGPSDLALTQFSASLAALAALVYLDGGEPAILSGTLELQLPDWRVRRRSWAVHPDCHCAANDWPARPAHRGAGGAAAPNRDNEWVSDIPKGQAARTARLATLPLGVAGRATLGVGKRLAGRSGEDVAAELQRRTAEQLFKVLGELKGGAMKFGQALSDLRGGPARGIGRAVPRGTDPAAGVGAADGGRGDAPGARRAVRQIVDPALSRIR